jgi:hypothetical protein
MSPRANIERHFAWVKRYFGLTNFRVQGFLAVTQFVFRVYIAALMGVWGLLNFAQRQGISEGY